MKKETCRRAEKETKNYHQLESTHTLNVNAKPICLEKKIQTFSKHSLGKESDKKLPFGSGIPKETLEELKHISRERKNLTNSPCIVDSSSVVTEIKLPNSFDTKTERSGLTFETFRPGMDKVSEKLLNKVEGSPSCESVNKSMHARHVEEVKQSSNGKHSLKKDVSSIATEKEFESASLDFFGQRPSGRKDLPSDSSEIPKPSNLISQVEAIKQQIAREDIHFIKFEVADLLGFSKTKTIPVRFFHEKVVNGIHMPRSYLELNKNSKVSGEDPKCATNFASDIVLKPELSTFAILPWSEKNSKIICDAYTIRGDPLVTSPRYLAKQLLKQLQEIGLSLHAGFTYEFSIFGVAETVNSKTVVFPAATLVTDHDHLFLQELFDGMYYIGGNIESFQDSGPGQMEISFQPEYGLIAADNAFTFRTGLKEVAEKYGYIASFFSDINEIYNSGIFTHSLRDENGKNMFNNGSQDLKLTDIGKKWLSGLIVHSAALSCLVAPDVSCRKHFAKGVKESKDNIRATCGFNDTSCTYNMKCYCAKGTYIENNLSSASANPYIVLAATVAAGLDGIRRGLDVFDETNQLKIHPIPFKMEDAITCLKDDKYFRIALGEAFIHLFVAVKQYELETEELDYERNKFLEYFI
ncbi:hypothetical protein GDO86_009866 [Hymenochirus boettgeri]|uniref:Lengsin n=1 Tax=Hymenochirus boettgeri TaxID=247094 RepID=A0A8T2JQN7_9PIPI|nr:hypothetical protein GDO86_009866 [Hymenochirus boettgeri]